jgi:hypothetical protein
MSTSLNVQILAALKQRIADHMASIPEEDGIEEFDIAHWGKQFADKVVSDLYLIHLSH